MANAWYDYNITNGHQNDDGVDIGTPSGTPVFFPFGGHIIDASWHDYGGQVVAEVPGSGYSEYFIHLTDETVRPGEDVAPGQIIGYTGGGVGDNVLHNGTVQPAQSQNWYDGHSGGPHTEYGIFEGTDMASFNAGWHNPSRQLDPTPIIEELQQGRGVSWPGGSSNAAAGVPVIGGFAQIASTLFPWLTNPVLFKYRAISFAIGAAGVALIGYGGLYIYAGVKGQSPVEVIQAQAAKARTSIEGAAKVAAVAV